MYVLFWHYNTTIRKQAVCPYVKNLLYKWNQSFIASYNESTYIHGSSVHGHRARYVNLRVAHAQGMPVTFSPPLRVSDPDLYHGTCVTHVPWCMPGLLTSGYRWSRWQGKRSRHSPRMPNPQFHVFGKRYMVTNYCLQWCFLVLLLCKSSYLL